MWLFKKKQERLVSYDVVKTIERYIKTADNNVPFMYIFVRNDLSEAQKIIQAGHAIERLTTNSEYDFNTSGHCTPHFALMGVDDEDDLKEVGKFLYDHLVTFEMFYEPDINEYTAIATVPLIGKDRLIMSGFKMFRGRV